MTSAFLALAGTRWALGERESEPQSLTLSYPGSVVLVLAACPPNLSFLLPSSPQVSQIMALAAVGFRFRVVPDAYVVHLPHAPSADIHRYRSDGDYRRCLAALKETFQAELGLRYPGWRVRVAAAAA